MESQKFVVEGCPSRGKVRRMGNAGALTPPFISYDDDNDDDNDFKVNWVSYPRMTVTMTLK